MDHLLHPEVCGCAHHQSRPPLRHRLRHHPQETVRSWIELGCSQSLSLAPFSYVLKNLINLQKQNNALSFFSRFFRNHVLLVGASVAGFYAAPFFTLMLLDIVNNSSVLQDIIRSITRPLPQLSVVFFTFIITVAIYAQFGE